MSTNRVAFVFLSLSLSLARVTTSCWVADICPLSPSSWRRSISPRRPRSASRPPVACACCGRNFAPPPRLVRWVLRRSAHFDTTARNRCGGRRFNDVNITTRQIPPWMIHQTITELRFSFSIGWRRRACRKCGAFCCFAMANQRSRTVFYIVSFFCVVPLQTHDTCVYRWFGVFRPERAANGTPRGALDIRRPHSFPRLRVFRRFLNE